MALVVGDGRTAARYAPAADIMMVDWYPVPHLPLESVGWNVRWTIEGSGGRPVWAVVQAMNWKDYRQHDPSKPRIGRFPTYTEMRFMAYDAIAEGASGIWFYSYRRPDGSLRSENPEHWGRVTAVVAELAFVRKLVARARPLPSPVPEAPAFAGLVGRAWERHGEDYALIVNASGAPAALPAKLCGLDWRLLRDGGSAWRAAGCRIAAHQALLFGSATLTK
ncbi:MAG: hypothetical protein KGK30_01570 [Elusimicrobia bacterium]|nr:hypothetical protein [Elusimicrobiota bacterium]